MADNSARGLPSRASMMSSVRHGESQLLFGRKSKRESITLFSSLPTEVVSSQPRFALYSTNLTAEDLGARVLFATDEFFAAADNLLLRKEPAFDPNEYCSQGKVMDGWESRRRRQPGHDWCVIRLAFQGTIDGFEVDTAHFTGNYAPQISIEAANIPEFSTDEHDEWMPGSFDRFERGGGIRGSKASAEMIDKARNACDKHEWHTLLHQSPLQPGYPDTRVHYFAIMDKKLKKIPFTHVRLNLFPDGGVARLKIYGTVSVDFERDVFSKLKKGQPVPLLDLASMALGGRGLACSNKHYGVPRNLLKPGRGLDMGDGWETARHMQRPPIIKTNPETGLVDTDLGDWCILQLGTVTDSIERLEVDTRHFKGNYPESIFIEAGYASTSVDLNDDLEDEDDNSFDDLDIQWNSLLPRTKLGPDKNFVFALDGGALNKLPKSVPQISHLRVNIYPDGGISRVRAFGRPMAKSKSKRGFF